jgi:hypothetical protein
MPFVTITCHVSEQLAREIASGGGTLLGLVTDANNGRVIKWLTPIAGKSSRVLKANRYIIIGAVVVAAAAGGTAYAYTRLNRKSRLATQLADVNRTAQEILQEHPTELTRDDLCRIRESIDQFLRFSEQRRYSTVSLKVPEDSKRILIAFADALRAFSEKLNTLAQSCEAIPEIGSMSNPADLRALLAAIRSQIEYQDRHWPAE